MGLKYIHAELIQFHEDAIVAKDTGGSLFKVAISEVMRDRCLQLNPDALGRAIDQHFMLTTPPGSAITVELSPANKEHQWAGVIPQVAASKIYGGHIHPEHVVVSSYVSTPKKMDSIFELRRRMPAPAISASGCQDPINEIMSRMTAHRPPQFPG